MLVAPVTNAVGQSCAAARDVRQIALGFPSLRVWLWACLLVPMVGCAHVQPSNHRNWSPDQAVLSEAYFNGDSVHVSNVRNCSYLNSDAYVLDYYDKTVDLDALRTVDFIMVPFRGMPSLAHTMLSFGLDNGEYLAVSVEIRKEVGEKYAVLGGFLNDFELMYVVGDEEDLVKLRTNYRGDDVYVYRARATPEQVQSLFVDVMHRVNELAGSPEFYNTFTNNCTTSIVNHINRLTPERVPYNLRVLLPGYSDRLAYDLGLIDTDATFEDTKRRALVGEAALLYADAPDFSRKIRR